MGNKRLASIGLSVAIASVSIANGFSGIASNIPGIVKVVKAAAYPVISEQGKLTSTLDIEGDVAKDYQNINIREGGFTIPFTVDKNGAVKITISSGTVQRTIMKYANGSSGEQLVDSVTSDKTVTLRFNIFRDKELIYNVGNTQSLSCETTGIVLNTRYLDAGTYYLGVEVPAGEATKSRVTTYSGALGLNIMYQMGTDDETLEDSSVTNPNMLQMGQEMKGYLTDISSADYYKFTVETPSKVTISAKMNTTKPGIITLYDSNNTAIVDKQSVTNNDTWSEVTKFLEAGDYYIRVASETGRGSTSVRVSASEFDIKLTTEVVKGAVRVNIDTVDNIQSMEYVKGVYGVGDINNSNVWNKATKINGTYFIPREDGDYTVRVIDKNGIRYCNSVTVTGVDVIAPSKPKISMAISGYDIIKGLAEPGSKIIVNYGSKVYEAQANSSGIWQVKLENNYLKKGNDIRVTSIDSTGNESEATVYKVEKVINPKITDIAIGLSVIKGTSAPGATIRISQPNGFSGTGKADKKGNWTVVSNTYKVAANQLVTITQTDLGTTTVSNEKKIGGKLNKITARYKSGKVTGNIALSKALKSKAGNYRVKVVAGKKSVIGKFNKKGIYSLSVKGLKLKRGNKIKVYAYIEFTPDNIIKSNEVSLKIK